MAGLSGGGQGGAGSAGRGCRSPSPALQHRARGTAGSTSRAALEELGREPSPAAPLAPSYALAHPSSPYVPASKTQPSEPRTCIGTATLALQLEEPKGENRRNRHDAFTFCKQKVTANK